MDAMNSFDSTPTTPMGFRPISRVETERADESQEPECCCPEFCQLDHAN